MVIIFKGVKNISNFNIKSVFLRPLLITISLIIIYRLGILIPIPFLNVEWSSGQFDIANIHTDERFSIFMLGIMPYVSAYILVEILSLCIPILNKLRAKDIKGRVKLKRISLVLALFLSICQTQALLSGIKESTFCNGNSPLNVSNDFEQVILISVIVGSFYLLLGLCELISKYGIGNGFSIIIMSGICGDFINRFPMYFKQFEYNGLFSYLIAFVVFCSLMYITNILLKAKVSIPCYHKKNNTIVDYFELNLSPSSMGALAYATTIIMLPVTISYFFGVDDCLSLNLQPGSLAYILSSIVFIFVFSFLFGWAFLHPNKRVKKMQRRGWYIADIDTAAESFLLKKLFIYNLPWTCLLCIMMTTPLILINNLNIPFYIGGSTIPVIAAISLDLIGSFKFYKKNIQQPMKVAEFHDIYDANMINNHLKAIGIESYLRGYHHRLLKYFFGPYIDISLIIDAQDKKRTQMLIQDYYDGLGLCRTKALQSDPGV